MKELNKIAFGGGCHWCTEAVFQCLKGVERVEQGYVASVDSHATFSEAVIIEFDSNQISLRTLIEIHLHTHKSTSNHSMRAKYRSAIYTFDENQLKTSKKILKEFQVDFKNELITKVLPFFQFKASRESIQNYYQKNPQKPFCKVFIDPKLKLVLQHFSSSVKHNAVGNFQPLTVQHQS